MLLSLFNVSLLVLCLSTWLCLCLCWSWPPLSCLLVSNYPTPLFSPNLVLVYLIVSTWYLCALLLYGSPFPSCLCWFVCVISLVRALVHPVVLVPALLHESSLLAGSSDLTVIWGFKNYHPQGQAWGCLSRYLVPVSLRVWSYPLSPTSLSSGCVPCPIVRTDCLPRPFVYPLLLINYITHVHSASGSFLDKPWHILDI